MELLKNYKRRIAVGIFLICLTILFLYWQSKEFLADMTRGPDLYNEVDLPITYEMMDSVSSGLEKYRHHFGHYPNVSGKYFLDSIKQYLAIPDVYIYADSIDKNNDTGVVRKKVGDKFKYETYAHTYVGIGTEKLILVYKRINPDSFRLYSVGKNLIDEDGKGDDIEFQP